MNTGWSLFLWSNLAGVLLLPAFSNAGYYPFDIEYLSVALLSVLLGAGFSQIARIPYVGLYLLLTLVGFTTITYFGDYMLKSLALMIGVVSFANWFIYLAFRFPDKVLILAGMVGFAQIVATAVATTPMIYALKEFSPQRKNLPPVVHLLLDEHFGIAAMPPEAVPPEKMAEFIKNYVDHGFIVFTHAYTADNNTRDSLGRLMNMDSKDPNSLLALVDNGKYSRFTQSNSFNRIAKDWVLDLTYIKALDMGWAVKKKTSVARMMGYDETNIREGVQKFSVPYQDRMDLAGAAALNWLYQGINSPTVSWVMNHTRSGNRYAIERAPYFHSFALTGQLILKNFIARLAENGKRGTYYFTHVLIPHAPYLFDENCKLLPDTERFTCPICRTTTTPFADRVNYYRTHFNQAQCATNDVFELTDALGKREETADSTIFIHSDHGARIKPIDFWKYKNSGYDQTNAERDMRGSFIAVKIAGMEGRVIDTPVRLDKVYYNLIINQFKSLDFDKLVPFKDSPYPYETETKTDKKDESKDKGKEGDSKKKN